WNTTCAVWLDATKVTQIGSATSSTPPTSTRCENKVINGRCSTMGKGASCRQVPHLKSAAPPREALAKRGHGGATRWRGLNRTLTRQRYRLARLVHATVGIRARSRRAWSVPLAADPMMELAGQLLCCLPHGHILEHIDRGSLTNLRRPRRADPDRERHFTPPDRPGHAILFDRAVLAAHAVES